VRPTIAEAFVENPNSISYSVISLSRNLMQRCFKGTLAMIVLKKICDTYIILQGFSRSSIFIITFFAEKAYFASKLQNSAPGKYFFIQASSSAVNIGRT